MRKSGWDALKSAASFSSCLPSSPDIACHHMISVAACAGDASAVTATATSCTNLEANCTVITLRCDEAEWIETAVAGIYEGPASKFSAGTAAQGNHSEIGLEVLATRRAGFACRALIDACDGS